MLKLAYFLNYCCRCGFVSRVSMEKLPDQTGSQILCPIPCSGAVSMGTMGSVEAIKFYKRGFNFLKGKRFKKNFLSRG